MNNYRYRPNYKRKNQGPNWDGLIWMIIFFTFVPTILSVTKSVFGFFVFPFITYWIIATLFKYSKSIKRSTYDFGNKTEVFFEYKEVSEKLKKYFANNKELKIFENVTLRLSDNTYESFNSLDLYHSGSLICSFDELVLKNPDMFKKILSIVSSKDLNSSNQTVKKSKNNNFYRANEFIEQINELNIEIPDSAITNGLYETVALLKQIGGVEIEFPENNEKLNKLYDYYLPMLINNISQYKTLQSAKFNSNFENIRLKVEKNVVLVNEAMKTIAASLKEEDFMNLSADINTLESLLRKDGLTGENVLPTLKKGGSDE